jgi:small subunit ribosomal protein S6
MLLALSLAGKGYRTQKEGIDLKSYETIFITHPDLSEEDHAEIERKLRSTIAGLKGDIIQLEDWGTKKLGYEIRKNNRGHYYLLHYLAEPPLVQEVERNLRLNDQVLKFQTVKVSDRMSAEADRKRKETPPAEKAGAASERPSPSDERGKQDQDKAESGGGEEK